MDEPQVKRLQHEYDAVNRLAIHYDSVATQMGAFLVAAALAAVPLALSRGDWAERLILGLASVLSYSVWLLTTEHMWAIQQIRMERLAELEGQLGYDHHLRIQAYSARRKRSWESQTIPTRTSRRWFLVALTLVWMIIVSLPAMRYSSQSAVADRELLLTAAASEVDTMVTMAAPKALEPRWGIKPVHVIGWLVTIVGFLVATIIAVRGWRATADTARDAQEQRRRIEEEWRKAELILRLRGTLETVAATARSTLKKDPKHAINPETMNGILVEWGRYDRVSDELHLLGDPSFEDRLETILGFSRMCAEKIMEDERRFRETRDRLGEVRPEGLYVHPSIIQGIEEKRQELHGLLGRMRDMAQAALEEFNRKWPPKSGHEERSAPESTGGDPTPTLPGPAPGPTAS